MVYKIFDHVYDFSINISCIFGIRTDLNFLNCSMQYQNIMQWAVFVVHNVKEAGKEDLT